MEKIKRKVYSLPVTLFIYMCVALIIAQLFYMLSLSIIEAAMLDFMSPSPDSIVFKDGRYITIWLDNTMPYKEAEVLDTDKFNMLNTIRAISPILIYGLCTLGATYIFYYRKLRKSLYTLNVGMKKISSKDLDFILESNSKDELGELCNAFEQMRRQLSHNFHMLWISEENQKNLYRAFAHDLRTPLTVIKGSNEIIELVAVENKDWKKVIEATSISNQAVERIAIYTNQLKTLDSIQELDIVKTKVSLETFVTKYKKQANILAKTYKKNLYIYCSSSDQIEIDQEIIIRILDNLLVNSLRYAKENIWLTFTLYKKGIEISISDDGEGFSKEAIKNATKPFFTTDKTKHMGIGLTISERLLLRLDSKINIENNKGIGSNIKFFIKV